MGVCWSAVGCLAPGEQLLQGHVAPAPALEFGEGDIHGDPLSPGGETALSPEGVQVARYLDQRLLDKVPEVGLYATPIPPEGRSQPSYEEVVEVRERPVGVRPPQLHEPLFVRAFSHLRPILSTLSLITVSPIRLRSRYDGRVRTD